MEPLVQTFTNTLQPCSGCGKSEILMANQETFFNVQVQVKAEDSFRVVEILSVLRNVEGVTLGSIIQLPRVQPAQQPSIGQVGKLEATSTLPPPNIQSTKP